MISTSTAMLFAAGVLFYFVGYVLAIFGSTRIGYHRIPVTPEDPPLGTLHRTLGEIAGWENSRSGCQWG